MCIFTMPQIFQVLRCYKCSIFQVHQTRKDNKWVCKICGEKQSVKRHYGIGTSKDCRTHVQKLNKLRGDKEESLVNIVDSEDSECDDIVDNTTSNIDDTKVLVKVNKESKWAAYIDEPEEQFERSEPVYINNKELLYKIPQKRKLNRKSQNIKRYRKSVDNKDNSESNIYNHLDNEMDSKGLFTTNIIDHKIENINPEIINVDDTNNRMKTKNIIPNLLLNKVYKDSKWVQFIDSEVLNNSDNEETEKNCNKQPLFSLCDDSEIDTILDL
ncbi:MRN complex-interacting protein [Nymphalis io]|uniref:MRN complex-interacting protein n=1 Tax=Inachis io TaxID=171585 RepID=UPI002169E0FF|nr:MRN complex-interacting protein [Nymphalis io]